MAQAPRTRLDSAAPVPKGVESTNLLVNGSFEDVTDDDASRPQDKGSTALKGWVVTRGQIDVTQQNGNEWKASHGKRALDLHGSPGFGGVEQTIATKPGKKYKVRFQMSGNPGVPERKKVQLGVRAAGQDKEFELSMEGRTYQDLKWEEQTWEFTAKEKATTVESHTAMPPHLERLRRAAARRRPSRRDQLTFRCRMLATTCPLAPYRSAHPTCVQTLKRARRRDTFPSFSTDAPPPGDPIVSREEGRT